ncbi:FemAB family XrtA/PEP-CTERM system-associated protein [Saccharospirillum impatiens]|uniref:FemAB family XrtA/PEP-CTERM system-associated protein n=1 Tax=Saccharospirillum impatiens TaxID=169438 RepID=UPI0004086150|nr:FemAB family XrtA/PEP-CTERM system-associated protein [Saccharospirillum impatiens]
MDVNDALKRPEQLAAFLSDLPYPAHAPSEACKADLLAKADALRRRQPELKQKLTEKKAIARQFREATDETREALKVTMALASQTLGLLETDLKAQRQALVAQLSALTEPPGTESIAQFQPWVSQTPQAFDGDITITDWEDPRWVDWCQRQPQRSQYHHPALGRAIQEAMGHRGPVLVAVSNNVVVGALPLIIQCSRLFGRFATSLPYFNYGGPLANSRDVAIALINAARPLLAEHQLSHIEIRTTQASLPFACNEQKVSMLLPLPTTDERLDQQLGAKVRAQANKAEEHKPEVRFGRADLLDDFYRVFAHNMRDLGTPVYSKAWFNTLLQTEAFNAQLVVVYQARRPVACGFLMGQGTMLEIPWASTLRRANPMNINMWMYRQILRWAVEQGYEWFDFGRSTRDAPTFQFKKQWGAQPVQHYWYTLTPGNKPAAATRPDSPKFRLMIAVWQRLPVWLTRVIGPPIVKQLP